MKRLPKQLEREVYIPTDKGVGKLGLQSREGSDWACLHNLLECSNVQDQSLLIRTPQIWWWVSLMKLCFSQIREAQKRLTSASVVAQRFSL